MALQNGLNKIGDFYSEGLRRLGANSLGVGWNGNDAQKIRYDQLTKLINFDSEVSICDYGCGYGYYFTYLSKFVEEWRGKYVGYDLSKDMIEAAIKMHGMNDEVHTFKIGSEIDEQFDYIVESGVFNLRFEKSDEECKEYILSVLNLFDKYSKKGFAFNALTKYSDKEKMRSDLYYADPLELFDYCKRNFSRNVALLHDYKLYDFTIIVRK